MPTHKRGVSAKGRPEVRDDDSTPASSPRRRVNEAVTPRGGKGPIESPTKGPQVSANRKARTTEDVRAEAFPIVPRGRGRPPSNKTPIASKVIADSDASPSRRSRRLTEQAAEDTLPSSSRSRVHSTASSIGKRESRPVSPMTTPRRGRGKSEMELAEDASEGTGLVETEGRGKRKRKLTEAAEASQAQIRSRKTSRRISERTDNFDQMDQIHELAEPIEEVAEEEEVEEEVHEEVVHDELLDAVSPHSQDHMYIQSHMPARPLHMGAPRTRGMHVVADHDEMLNEQMVEEEHVMDEMVVYDDEGNMIIGFEGEDMGHEEIIEGVEEDEQGEMDMMGHHAQRGHVIQPHAIDEMQQHQQGDEQMMRRQDMGRQIGIQPHDVKQEAVQDDDDDDDQPPQLEPEEGPPAEEILQIESMERAQMMETYEEPQAYMSPGGTHYMDDDMYVEGVVDQGMVMPMDEVEAAAAPTDMRTVEFNFLDNKNVCCGLCGDIVPYESLLSEHLPMQHPEVYGEGMCDLEEISYDSWLKDKLFHEKKSLENGFRTMSYEHQGTSGMSRMGRNTRVLRRVSQVRVNPGLMSLAQLDLALKKKMIEKMGRRVKVSLVDKQHARCGICNAVVSLNKKFEVVHLVRHFNAWHPSVHRCSGTWPNRSHLAGPGKPLSSQDFAVVDQALDAAESLQCIWCGMFMDRTMLAMHFHEVHPDDVEVPKCHLCLQEVVINARLHEKHGQDFGISLPDEHHIKCGRLDGKTFSTEAALDRFLERRKSRMEAVESGQIISIEEDEAAEEAEQPATAEHQRDPQYSNSRMAFGRRNKPKRNFIMPSLRQAIPQDSRYVEAISEGEWRCKMCGEPILAAVISAGAIKHYRLSHPEQLEEMQYELCKARLERVSDGCMEFVSPEMIECLICNLTYALHKPYNMCRGIRHLKTKHPHMMPEYNRAEPTKVPVHKKGAHFQRQQGPPRVEMGEFVDDPEVINKLKQEYDYEFDKVQAMYTAEGERVLVLVTDGQEIDERVAENIQASILTSAHSVEGEEEDEDDGEEGVIVEEEEYHMDDEIVVRDSDHVDTVNGEVRRSRHQIEVMDDVEEEEEEVGQEEEVEIGEEGIDEREEEEELVEETEGQEEFQ